MNSNRPTIIGNGGGGEGSSTLFDRADLNATQTETGNLAALQAYLERHQFPTPPSAIPFLPYLVVRSLAGDHGERPPTSPLAVSSSPDIWVIAGAPSGNPDVPPPPGTGLADLGPLAGQQATVYAHVWNLGRAPAGGVKIDWYWSPTPQCGDVPDGSQANPIGFEMVDLGPRSSMGCHRLVKCPTAFTVPAGAVSVFAQVSVLGDPLLTPWRPDVDRHVARKDFGSATEEVLDQAFDPRSVDPNTYAPAGASLCSYPAYRPVQTFTAGVSGQLSRVEVLLGDGVGKNIDVALFNTAGGAPSGAAIASGQIPSGQVPGSVPAFVSVPLSAPVTSGTVYAIGLATEPPPLVCWAAQTWKGSASSPYAGGALYLDGILDPAQSDMGFRTYVCRPFTGLAPRRDAASSPGHAPVHKHGPTAKPVAPRGSHGKNPK